MTQSRGSPQATLIESYVAESIDGSGNGGRRSARPGADIADGHV